MEGRKELMTESGSRGKARAQVDRLQISWSAVEIDQIRRHQEVGRDIYKHNGSVTNMGRPEKQRPRVPGAKVWTRGTRIGTGNYASVFVATNSENGKKFAVKSVDKSNLEKRLALEVERRLLKMCKSPYVVKYLGCGTDRVKDMNNQHTFNLLLELVPRGSVLEHIRRQDHRLPEPIVAAYTRDILKGLSYLHSRGIVHGDIKATNCLIGRDNIKLCDFGSGKHIPDGDLPLEPGRRAEHMKKRIFTTGTDGYKAPEVVDETEQGPPSDIYSLGCTVVEMCTGYPPNPLMHKGKNHGKFNPETGLPIMCLDVPPSYSDECRDFVEECLQPDPYDRPDADELLKHAWFSKPCPYPVDKSSVPRSSPPPPRSHRGPAPVPRSSPPPHRSHPPVSRPPPPPSPPGILNKCGNIFGCKC